MYSLFFCYQLPSPPPRDYRVCWCLSQHLLDMLQGHHRTHMTIHSHAHTDEQLSISNKPNVYVFGLRGKTSSQRKPTHIQGKHGNTQTKA